VEDLLYTLGPKILSDRVRHSNMYVTVQVYAIAQPGTIA
jgi:hypothetical protein